MNEEDTCRICLGPAEPEDPLLQPCKCSGTVALVHESCCLVWLSKQQQRSCDVCGDAIVVAQPSTFLRLCRALKPVAKFLVVSAFTLCVVAALVWEFSMCTHVLYCFMRFVVLNDEHNDYTFDLYGVHMICSGTRLLLLFMAASWVLGTLAKAEIRYSKDPQLKDALLKETHLHTEFPKVSSVRRYFAMMSHLDPLDDLHIFPVVLLIIIFPPLLLFLSVLIRREAAPGLDGLAFWKPQCIRDVPTDYVFILAATEFLLATLLSLKWLRESESLQQEGLTLENLRIIERSIATTAAFFVIPYLYTVALVYAASGQLDFPALHQWRVWLYWFVGSVFWYDWKANSETFGMIREEHEDEKPSYTPTSAILTFVWPCVQFLPTLLNHSLMIWGFRRTTQPTLTSSDLRWYALPLVALLTSLGPTQPPLSYVALAWLKERLGMQLVAWLPTRLAVPELVLAARAWCLVAMLGFVPLLIGRAVAPGTNDLLLWVSVLSLELPALGFFLRFEESQASFQNWIQNWIQNWRHSQSIGWHSTLISLVLVGAWCWFTGTSWTTQDALVAILTMVWPVEWYTALLLPLNSRKVGVLRLFLLGAVAWFHSVMYETQPDTLIDYKDPQHLESLDQGDASSSTNANMV